MLCYRLYQCISTELRARGKTVRYVILLESNMALPAVQKAGALCAFEHEKRQMYTLFVLKGFF